MEWKSPMITASLLAMIGVFLSSVQCAITAAPMCLRGQVYSSCPPCGGTISCANPNPEICPLICRPGCVCKEGTILNEKAGRCVTNCSVPVRPHLKKTNRCPRSLVFTHCLSCGNRPLTCNDTASGGPCLPDCEAGCDCPRGRILDTRIQRCVSVKKCARSLSNLRCPIKGQVRKTCVTCYRNPFTCTSPDHQACPRICVGGCECPDGQVLDIVNRRCVVLENCPCE